MKLSVSAVAVLALASTILVFNELVSAETVGEVPEGQVTSKGFLSRYQLPRSLSFEEFCVKFHKKYNSLTELAVRKAKFLASTIRAAVSSILYRYKRKPYRLGVNHMSDYTEAEIKMMANRHAPPVVPTDSSHVIEINEKNLHEHLHKLERRRRDTSNMLEEQKSESAEADSNQVASEVGPKKAKMMDVKFWNFNEQGSNGTEEKFVDSPGEDEVFLDLRSTSCFGSPRSQGLCGSCWLFAMVAMFEWHFCMSTRMRLMFSEQYLVDCTAQVEGENGCTGGNFVVGAKLVHNYGLELLNSYPYIARDNECPFGPTDDLLTAGKLKVNLENTAFVPVKLWPLILNYGPIYLDLKVTSEFTQYERGVHDNQNCELEGSLHAMVVVGHGREAGREYWLIRNSHSVGWGEQGYYKLAKSANHCIFDGRGHSIVVNLGDDPRQSFKWHVNKHHDEDKLKRHYSKVSRWWLPEPPLPQPKLTIVAK